MTDSTLLTEYRSFFVDGGWENPSSDATISVTSPVTELQIGLVPDGRKADIDHAVAAARRAFDAPDGWATWSPARRKEALDRFADAIDARKQVMAETISSQNGMPITTALGVEGFFPSYLLRYYSQLIVENGPEERRAGAFGGTTIVRRDAVGVVGAIVPWNFPQALAFMKLAPALAAGCTVVLKPSPETVLDSYILAEAALDAGLPAGVLNIVPGGSEAGEHLVTHPGVDKISFTGSTAAGRKIAAACGSLLRPVSLELGGKSAAVILDDADLASHSADLFTATLNNNGQTCYISTRILAPRSRYEEVVDFVAAMAREATVGDPMDPETTIGPLVSQRQLDRVNSYIERGIRDGARRVTGSEGLPAGTDRGYFVAPTVFADVDNSAVIAQEEIFGPVLTVIAYDDDADAVRIANDSEFGLGGSVWSTDGARAVAVARGIATGSIGINSYINDPNSPFGGVKSSGIGRELGPEGLSAFQTVKSIYAAPED